MYICITLRIPVRSFCLVVRASTRVFFSTDAYGLRKRKRIVKKDNSIIALVIERFMWGFYLLRRSAVVFGIRCDNNNTNNKIRLYFYDREWLFLSVRGCK